MRVNENRKQNWTGKNLAAGTAVLLGEKFEDQPQSACSHSGIGHPASGTIPGKGVLYKS